LAIIGIVLMMVLPLPAWLLDVLLGCSLALAVGVFLTALFIQEALEFSAFPAFVLVATLLRLSLNVATTRLILLHGNEGNGAAGAVVEAFGRFVVEGNVLVGLVVFLILVVINFVVVTKGAGRVAEVAARFTLDAMPGKQMAVDADLSSGAITADQARKKRRDLEREADFYGAMDGASKFVHGDAIAGLLITAINLIGGLILGMSRGMSLAEAAETFSVLSVGDALVSQMPSLLISAASGIVVARSATGDQIGRAFGTQLFSRPRPIYMTAGVVCLLGLMPGMPFVPCTALALVLAVLARKIQSPGVAQDPSAEAAGKDVAKDPMEQVESALSLDMLSLEIGYELTPIVDAAAGGTLLSRVAALRLQVAKELGVVVPPVHVTDNLELAPGDYRVMLLGVPIASGTCRRGKLLAMATDESAPAVDGDPCVDPTFGLPARWILPRDREIAEALGHAVVDHATIVATHMSEALRTNAHRLLGRQELQHLFDLLARVAPRLVDDLVPNLLSHGDVLRVLRNLLREGISIRDLRSILEALAELAPQTKDAEQLTELVRERLASQITTKLRGSDGAVCVLTLSPETETVLRGSLRDIATGNGGAPAPELLGALTAHAERTLPQFNAQGATPVVVCPPDLRRYVRAIFDRKLPQLQVISFRELEPQVPLRFVAALSPAAA
jgi:flagellar biosynthesis protein FlhA